MGRRSTIDRAQKPSWLATGWIWLGVALAGSSIGDTARAQTLLDKVTERVAPTPGATPDRMLVNADEMVYDRNSETVEARKNVQIYYQGRVLQADHVRYNRKSNRLFADGHVKLTERDGSVAYADRMDLSDDFRDGFVDSLRADTADATQFTAARTERTAGNTTVLDRATYSACTPCQADATKSPTWQIRAKRIIHDNDEQTIYFEDATFEFLGVPLAWVPYFSAPDPSVKRKSGLLTPGYVYNSTLGLGVTAPVYWAVAPNMDLTLTPSFYTQQGFALQGEWRHQLANGAYNIRASGIFQSDPGAFANPPYGPGNKDFRGAIETKGEFYINDKWRFGWNVNLLTDKWYYTDYRLPSEALSTNFFREATSTAYLTGQGEHGYFDLRGYYFQGLSLHDLQEQQPIVAPVLDWNKTIDLAPSKTGGVGGRIEIDANATHISRQLAAFQSTGARTLDSLYNLYSVCTIYVPGKCLVQGIGGEYSRATLNVSWKRQFIDPIGQVWTPFVFAHLNGSYVDFNKGRTQMYGASVISNASQANFFGPDFNTSNASVTPGAGLEYRYPFIMANDWATHTFEPIAQIIVRPNVPSNTALINEDAQSLVFDDTTLFSWNKYSGYDRFEGGTRANYGGQYTMTFKNGAYANFLVGQSLQVAGQNSFATPDAANVGLSSGLDKRASDIVSRFSFSTASSFAFIAKARFDPNSFEMRRLDMTSTARFGALEATLQYARYTAQPVTGFDRRREGVSASFKYKLEQGYYTTGSVIFDMSRHLYDNFGNIISSTPLFFPAGFGVGVGYSDPDTTFGLNYTNVYQDNGNGAPVRNQTVSVQLQLRTLGDAKISRSLGDIAVQDGLSSLTQ
jgi:LPS-assembly protein